MHIRFARKTKVESFGALRTGGALALPLCILTILFASARAGGEEGAAPAKGATVVLDDLGRRVVLDKTPERIVTISGTPIDVIFELGADDKIIGVPDSLSRSYPEMCRKHPSLLERTKVGRFDNPNIEKIVSLAPDLILCHGSSDSPGRYTAVFEKRKLPYAALSTIRDVAHGLDQTKRLGKLLGKEKEAEALAGRIRSEVDALARQIAAKTKDRPLVYYWWGTGNGTYGKRGAISELIALAGGVNLAGEFDSAYMQLSPEYVVSKNPDVIVLSYWQESQREPRLNEIKQRPGFDQVKAVKANRVYAIDGHSFHTPVRFAEVIRNLAGFFHPGVLDDKTPAGP